VLAGPIAFGRRDVLGRGRHGVGGEGTRRASARRLARQRTYQLLCSDHIRRRQLARERDHRQRDTQAPLRLVEFGLGLGLAHRARQPHAQSVVGLVVAQLQRGLEHVQADAAAGGEEGQLDCDGEFGGARRAYGGGVELVGVVAQVRVAPVNDRVVGRGVARRRSVTYRVVVGVGVRGVARFLLTLQLTKT